MIRAGIPCTIGSNLEREVATAAMAHVTVCTANIQCERFPGDLIGPIYYQQALTRQQYEVLRKAYSGSAASGTLLETVQTCYNNNCSLASPQPRASR